MANVQKPKKKKKLQLFNNKPHKKVTKPVKEEINVEDVAQIEGNPTEIKSDFVEEVNKDIENTSSLSQVVKEIDREKEQKEVINNEQEQVIDKDLVFIELDKDEPSVSNTQTKKDKAKRKRKTRKEPKVEEPKVEEQVVEGVQVENTIVEPVSVENIGVEKSKIEPAFVEELQLDKPVEKKQKRVKPKSVKPAKKPLDKRIKENIQATIFGLCFLIVVGGVFLWFEVFRGTTNQEQPNTNTVAEVSPPVPDTSTTVTDNSVENIVKEPTPISVPKEYVKKDDAFYADFDLIMIERIRSYFYDTISEDLQIISCEKYDWSIYDTIQEYVWIVRIYNQGVDEYYKCHIMVDFNDEITDITCEDISEEYVVSQPAPIVEENAENVE